MKVQWEGAAGGGYITTVDGHELRVKQALVGVMNRWCFYIDGQRVGSASDANSARRGCVDHLKLRQVQPA